MQKYAVGYIRGRVIAGKQTRDWAMQERAMRVYADTHSYNYLKTFGDVQTDVDGTNLVLLQLKQAVQLCEEIGSDLLYIQLRRWRRNLIFFKVIRCIRKSATGFRAIGIYDRNILEVIQVLSKYDKHHRPDGTPIRHRSPQVKKAVRCAIDPCLEWKERSGVATKRYRNFRHLIAGPDSICEVMHSQPSKSNEELAVILNQKRYLTVDGKPWRKENVRRTRKLMQSMEFKEYCDEQRKKLPKWI